MRKSRIGILILATVLSVSLLSGCSLTGNSKNIKEDNGSGSTNKDKFSGVTINIVSTDYTIPSEKLQEEFTKKTGIKLKYENLSWQQIPAALEINKLESDVVQVDWTVIGQYKRNDILEPLNKEDIDIEDIPSIAAFYYEDEIYAVPCFNDFTVMLYNKEHYKKAGIGKFPKTWDEVYEDSKKIAEANITRYPFYIGLSDSLDISSEVISLAYSRSGKLFNDDGSLSVESADDTLTFIDNMLREELVSKSSSKYYVLDDFRKIATGETSSMIGLGSYMIGLNDSSKSNVVGKIEVSSLPGGDSNSNESFASPEGLAIIKASKNKEAAKKYIDWYTSREIQKKLYKESNILPSRISVLSDIIKSNDLENSSRLIEIAKNTKFPIPEGTKKYYKEIGEIIAFCVNRMATGDMNKDESLYLMDTAITQVLNGGPMPEQINFTVE